MTTIKDDTKNNEEKEIQFFIERLAEVLIEQVKGEEMKASPNKE